MATCRASMSALVREYIAIPFRGNAWIDGHAPSQPSLQGIAFTLSSLETRKSDVCFQIFLVPLLLTCVYRLGIAGRPLQWRGHIVNTLSDVGLRTILMNTHTNSIRKGRQHIINTWRSRGLGDQTCASVGGKCLCGSAAPQRSTSTCLILRRSDAGVGVCFDDPPGMHSPILQLCWIKN